MQDWSSTATPSPSLPRALAPVARPHCFLETLTAIHWPHLGPALGWGLQTAGK